MEQEPSNGEQHQYVGHPWAIAAALREGEPYRVRDLHPKGIVDPEMKRVPLAMLQVGGLTAETLEQDRELYMGRLLRLYDKVRGQEVVLRLEQGALGTFWVEVENEDGSWRLLPLPDLSDDSTKVDFLNRRFRMKRVYLVPPVFSEYLILLHNRYKDYLNREDATKELQRKFIIENLPGLRVEYFSKDAVRAQVEAVPDVWLGGNVQALLHNSYVELGNYGLELAIGSVPFVSFLYDVFELARIVFRKDRRSLFQIGKSDEELEDFLARHYLPEDFFDEEYKMALIEGGDVVIEGLISILTLLPTLEGEVLNITFGALLDIAIKTIRRMPRAVGITRRRWASKLMLLAWTNEDFLRNPQEFKRMKRLAFIIRRVGDDLVRYIGSQIEIETK